MIGTRKARAFVLAAAAAAMLAGPAVTPAAAGTPADSAKRVTSADRCFSYAFGYTEETMCGSVMMGLDYTGDGVKDEYFDVRIDRVVVHAWPGSGQWRPLTNGRADKMYNVHYDPSTGYRRVDVWVNNSGVWCTSYMPGRNWYNFWKC